MVQDLDALNAAIQLGYYPKLPVGTVAVFCSKSFSTRGEILYKGAVIKVSGAHYHVRTKKRAVYSPYLSVVKVESIPEDSPPWREWPVLVRDK